jgi:hypothetical protein
VTRGRRYRLDAADVRAVIITEGLADALAASLAWPQAFVLGPHGAGNYKGIARPTAPRAKLAAGRLLLCVEVDDPDEVALRHALGAGLLLDRSLILVDHADHGAYHDLTDALAAGLRPT